MFTQRGTHRRTTEYRPRLVEEGPEEFDHNGETAVQGCGVKGEKDCSIKGGDSRDKGGSQVGISAQRNNPIETPKEMETRVVGKGNSFTWQRDLSS